MLSVENGSARHATALGSGEETTFSYTVTAKHGVHCFQPATIVFRDISSSVAVETTITVETKLTCRSPIQTISLGHIAHQHAGSTVATNGLTGIEFSKVRSYRFGDPPNRIDWNRYARDKELTTISFREDRSRAVILCIDARAICYRSSSRTEPHAVFYERAAARELLGTVSRSDEPIGLLVLGPDHYWIAPNTGSHHSTILQRTLDDTDILPLKPPSRNGTKNNVDMQMNSLKTKIAKNTSIILLSPLVDDVPLETAQVLRATGHSVTVLSPDVTTTGSLGTELARLQRTNRINVLRRTPISVIDWNPKTPLETALYSTVNP
ncbi:hypothetical protein C484_17606 [Natrialba taiwanensis DSM 12281]|uniref:DUF58 domain-containing protein n=2 Tax=Natrialba taiwanensis TaxID=160846 RepID=L9ZKZ4_9EURY|nr:hypothetical protein C484_17606 [Natrialba taiwanensis DSM 12281]